LYNNIWAIQPKFLLSGTKARHLVGVLYRNSLKLVLTLSGHEDHVWSVDMDHDLIVTGAWDSR
jgi:hypothetical protein